MLCQLLVSLCMICKFILDISWVFCLHTDSYSKEDLFSNATESPFYAHRKFLICSNSFSPPILTKLVCRFMGAWPWHLIHNHKIFDGYFWKMAVFFTLHHWATNSMCISGSEKWPLFMRGSWLMYVHRDFLPQTLIKMNHLKAFRLNDNWHMLSTAREKHLSLLCLYNYHFETIESEFGKPCNRRKVCVSCYFIHD